jgi:D-alanyl-D-alanine carboxypeptidase
MPLPAEPPRVGVEPPPDQRDPRPLRRLRRTPRTRVAAAVLAVFAGIALLTVGIVQTTGGLAGTALGTTRPTPSDTTRSGGAGSGAIVASGGPVDSGEPSATPQPSVSATPIGSTPPVAPSGSPIPGPTTAEQQTQLLHARLQATLDRVRTRLGIPGVSTTILFPDGTSWTGVSGLADVTGRVPVKPSTAFAFASMSKTFTSALIVQLVAEGRLRLNDLAVTLLPRMAKPIDRRITLAMLLDHTSGLNDYFLNPKIDRPLQADPTRAWTTDQALAYVRKPYFPPGKGWHYSNTNYLLLGLIAERVTGQPLAVAIRQRLLDPSGLAATWYQAAERPRTDLAHGYRLPGTKPTVKPIDLDDGSGIAPFRSVVTAAAGAGSLAGTSDDLARWARHLYSGELLGPEGTAVLLGGFSATAGYRPSIPYGYGVQAIVINGHPSFGHSGRLLGFRGAVRHFPVDGLTIAVLTNQSRADPGVIVRSLLAAALPPPPACPICVLSR